MNGPKILLDLLDWTSTTSNKIDLQAGPILKPMGFELLHSKTQPCMLMCKGPVQAMIKIYF